MRVPPPVKVSEPGTPDQSAVDAPPVAVARSGTATSRPGSADSETSTLTDAPSATRYAATPKDTAMRGRSSSAIATAVASSVPPPRLALTGPLRVSEKVSSAPGSYTASSTICTVTVADTDSRAKVSVPVALT